MKLILEGGQVVTEAVYGKCNCEYNGLILKDGENLTLSTGIEASCFGGAMVTLVNKTSTHPGKRKENSFNKS